MLNNPWKTRIIRFAHLHQGQSVPTATLTGSSRTILGKTIHKRIFMSPSTNWLNRIKGEIRYDEPIAYHTSLRVGGPADVFIVPKDVSDLQLIFKNHGDMPLFILGEGTNLIMNNGDVFMTLGAGNVWELGRDLLANLPERLREGKPGKDS